MILSDLRRWGLDKVDLIVSYGITGLEDAVGRVYPRSDFQQCITHVKRRMLARVRAEDKQDLADDLREVFATDTRDDTPEAGWDRWQSHGKKWGRTHRSFKRTIEHRFTVPSLLYLFEV